MDHGPVEIASSSCSQKRVMQIDTEEFSSKRLKRIEEALECPVCFDIPKSAPVPVCPNGHVVCVKCVREVCPTCRVRMEDGTSTLAVTVIENIEHTCEHEDCGQSLPHSEIKSKNN